MLISTFLARSWTQVYTTSFSAPVYTPAIAGTKYTYHEWQPGWVSPSACFYIKIVLLFCQWSVGHPFKY